uniref:Uncharacterized protein n=1 Tax=Dendroctonus ponderosae TaxID=77166 RepID=J3JTZ5_DENPD|nr:unknown [Dendroctonus ponderosae]
MKRQCSQCLASRVERQFKPVTHFIFDLDGVIIDSEKIYKKAFQKTVEDYGQTFTDASYRMMSGRTGANVAKITIKEYNLNVLPADLINKYRGYSYPALINVELLPGVERLIKHLYQHHVPIAIATSSAKESFMMKTRRFGHLINLFDHIVCGGDPEVKTGKPDPDIYLVCASRFAQKPHPSKCLVFEDSEIGLRAALSANMQVVLTPNETVPEEIWALATLKIESLEVFAPDLFGLPAFT